MSLTIILGVLNACLGSLLSALGYCLQRLAHLRKPPEQSILRTPYYWYGLILLILGTVSNVGNLALLDQAVQAPFAALTLVFNAVLAWKILHERFTSIDAISTILILGGVVLAMIGALQTSVEDEGYSQDELWGLWSRNTLPLIFTVVSLGGVIIWNIYVEQGRQKTNSALLCYGISGGIMGGFTALFVKSTIELIKSGLRFDQLLYYLCPVLIPFGLLPQLRFMNQGFAHFGTLKFVPIYQSFLILGNLLCGIIYFNELADFATASVYMFFIGCVITLTGVGVLTFKVDEDDVSPQYVHCETECT